MYWTSGWIDGMFWLSTYRAILNLSKKEEEKFKTDLSDLNDITIDKKQRSNEVTETKKVVQYDANKISFF